MRRPRRDILYNITSQCHECSTIISTNLAFKRWGITADSWRGTDSFDHDADKADNPKRKA